ncbi:hypothetical protein [Streptomyces sp. NPDC017435]|uniref:hypothetical protein n=1 Tax=Streptomyces sp. NPDC017435 TaxID=3364995 RepID=UPI00378CECF9
MPFEEGFLAARSEDAMDGLARVGQAEREQIAGHKLAGEPDRDVAEVDLGFHAGLVSLRHECLDRCFPRLDQDLRLPVGDVAPDHLVRDVRGVFLDQAVEDPRDRVPLLARRVQIRPQHLIDEGFVQIQRGRPRRQLLPWLGPDRAHGLADRPPSHVVLALDFPDLHTAAVVAADRRVQLDLRHLRHDQALSPGASRCSRGKDSGDFKTREHHPTVDLDAYQTREQRASQPGFWLAFRDACTVSDGRCSDQAPGSCPK